MPDNEPQVGEKAQLPAVGAVEWLADAAAEFAESGTGGEGGEKRKEAAAVGPSLSLSLSCHFAPLADLHLPSSPSLPTRRPVDSRFFSARPLSPETALPLPDPIRPHQDALLEFQG